VGTIGVAPYPVQTPFGMRYQNMEVKIDDALLQQIAAMTDGKYFRATSNQKLEAVYQEIDQLEKSKIDVTEFHKKTEEFYPLALLALMLFGLEILLKNTLFRSTP
jgi:Ca-activated chloride channel family protein